MDDIIEFNDWLGSIGQNELYNDAPVHSVDSIEPILNYRDCERINGRD